MATFVPISHPPLATVFLFAERLFILFDSDGSGTITLQELQKALTLLIHVFPWTNSNSSSRCMTSTVSILCGMGGLRGRAWSGPISVTTQHWANVSRGRQQLPLCGLLPALSSSPFLLGERVDTGRQTNALDSTHEKPELSLLFSMFLKKGMVCCFLIIVIAHYEHFRQYRMVLKRKQKSPIAFFYTAYN